MSNRSRVTAHSLWAAVGLSGAALLVLLTAGSMVAQADCPSGPAYCDSVILTAPCMVICPLGDVSYTVIVRDSCGSPVCDPAGVWLDFSGSGASACPDKEPDWPRVHPDSCDPVTGAHYFSVAASIDTCWESGAGLYVGGSYCRGIWAKFFDSNGDHCVTQDDAYSIYGGPCAAYLDFDCDGTRSIADVVILARHSNHCCSCFCPMQGDANDDHVIDVLDVNALIDFTFQSGRTPAVDSSCVAPNRGEVNCDGVVDVLDVIGLINYTFSNGLEPCIPCLCPAYPGNCPR